MRALLPLLLLGLAVAPAQAESRPSQLPFVETIPVAQDVPYPGIIISEVDATNLSQRIFDVHQVVPVAGPGRLTLLLPKWIPGKHRVFGSIRAIAGLVITAHGQPLPWQRDNVDVFAFHVDVPAGVDALEVNFQFLSPTAPNQGREVVTPEMLNLQWWDLVLYPAGHYTRQIRIQPTVILPKGWAAATSLDLAAQEGDRFVYETTTVDVLIDSPMFAGRHYRPEDLGDNVTLHLFADEPGELAATDEQIAKHRTLVEQSLKLFGGQHYGDYEFLVAISDTLGGIGLEHQSSSENQVDPGYFIDWDDSVFDRDLLAHEIVHSWNGKYRRPAGMWTADFRTPMRDDLLWLYEGQTQYWGYVLAARAGLMSKEEFLGMLGSTAARFSAGRPGRQWRPLADTTHDPIIASRLPKGWSSWQRAEDYYSEGLLIWLDADTLIREATAGEKSLDDFARAFFGVNDGDLGQLTYTFDDIVETLHAVHPFDWGPWLRARVHHIAPAAPLDGVTRGGYALRFDAERPAYFKAAESKFNYLGLDYSLGLSLSKAGDIRGVVWDSPAFAHGLAAGQTIIGLNGRVYDQKRLRQLLDDGTSPLELLVQAGDVIRPVKIDYDGGQRYPSLRPRADAKAWIDDIIAPRP